MAEASSESLLWQLILKIQIKAGFHVLLFRDSIARILGILRRRTLWFIFLAHIID